MQATANNSQHFFAHLQKTANNSRWFSANWQTTDNDWLYNLTILAGDSNYYEHFAFLSHDWAGANYTEVVGIDGIIVMSVSLKTKDDKEMFRQTAR